MTGGGFPASTSRRSDSSAPHPEPVCNELTVPVVFSPRTLVEHGLDTCLGDRRLHALDRVRPLPVHRFHGNRDRPVHLGPRPALSWTERDVFKLGSGQAGLDLEVGFGRAGEEFLPATTTGGRSPR